MGWETIVVIIAFLLGAFTGIWDSLRSKKEVDEKRRELEWKIVGIVGIIVLVFFFVVLILSLRT